MLNVWDTAGQEIYRSIVPIYVRSATGAIIVYDVTDRASFTAVSDWYELMAAEELPSGVDLYVVGNKIDRADDRVVDGDSGKEMSASIRGKFFEVSALAGIGVRELFEAIAAAQALRQRTDSDTVGHGMDAGGGCC
jgi:small GTP-binding protein